MLEEAKSDVEQEPILSIYYHASITSHRSLDSDLANILSEKLYETMDKQLAETYWSETPGAGTATTATRLVFRSRISKLTQLRAQSATSRRPKARFRW
ncbi:BnaC05g32410D [Brassica napus]|uniref:(rape) hypothetical protein n=2 Tax=Brassica napus TaxID=3708 RepID=A0A078GHC6_BRANA|nr:unnamed protein product [Brassica napus]CDY24557.1 BnaC05g32410D [Brassica napus]